MASHYKKTRALAIANCQIMFDEDSIWSAVQTLEDQGCPLITTALLIDTIHDNIDHSIHISMGTVKPKVSKIAQDHKNRVMIAKQRLQEMIDEIKIKCRVCSDSKADMLLLPCAHLVCCTKCVDTVRFCPLSTCGKLVRGTKEVYFC